MAYVFYPSQHKLRKLEGKLPDLYLNDTKLEFVDNYRYLGIELDGCLKMEKQVEYVMSRVKPLLYSLGKLRYFIDFI